MFDDACFACGTPVECGHAYCSDECAFQDAGSDHSGLSESTIPSLKPFRPSPSKVAQDDHMTSTVTPGGRILPFALHNPHPEFALPIAQYASAYTRKREDIQRKRSSLSSSDASSAFSTPSAPPLTDDDDSMSDPEFILDAQPDAESARPALSYARRPSATDTRSTVKPHMPARSAASSTMPVSDSSRAQSNASTHSQEKRSRTPSRTRRSRDALALLDDINKLLYTDDRDRRRHTDHIRPHSYRIHRRSHDDFEEQADSSRVEDLDASYATLTKFSVAAKAAEAIRSPKSRRAPTIKRPRASLPAYFNLTKISRPSPGGFATWCDGASTSQETGSRPARPSHKSSATVACTDMSSSTATLSGSIRTSAATVATNLRTSNSSPAPSQTQSRHATNGSRPGSPSSGVPDDKMVRTGAEPVPQETDDALAAQMASAIRQASALDALHGNISTSSVALVDGTPRGRTRSRSTRPRSRSRSRTRERAQRAHFGGSPGLRSANAVPAPAAELSMTSRGRPQTKAGDAEAGAEAPSFSRGRRERKQVADADEERLREVSAQLAQLDIEWLDVTDEPEPAAVPERSSRRRAILLA